MSDQMKDLPDSERAKIQQTWANICATAWKDPSFRKKLIDNPNQMLKEKGAPVPDGVNFVVVENSASRYHLVLPNSPSSSGATEKVSIESLSDYDPGF